MRIRRLRGGFCRACVRLSALGYMLVCTGLRTSPKLPVLVRYCASLRVRHLCSAPLVAVEAAIKAVTVYPCLEDSLGDPDDEHARRQCYPASLRPAAARKFSRSASCEEMQGGAAVRCAICREFDQHGRMS